MEEPPRNLITRKDYEALPSPLFDHGWDYIRMGYYYLNFPERSALWSDQGTMKPYMGESDDEEGKEKD